MGIDLEALRLDLPEENLAAPDGVSRWWRVLTLLLVLGVATLAYLYLFVTPAQSQGGIPIRVHAVGRAVADKAQAFTAGGWVEPAWPNPIVVSARVEGTIDELLVAMGDDVGYDQEIARLDPASYEAAAAAATARSDAATARSEEAAARLARLKAGTRPEEIEAARAARKRAEANFARMSAGYRVEEIAQANARMEEMRIQVKYLEGVVRRNEELRRSGGFALGKIERDEAEYHSMLRRAEAAEAELARLKAGYLTTEVDEARAGLEEADQHLKLLISGARPQEIEEAEAAAKTAAAEAEASKAELAAAELQLAYCSIKAPIAGRVLDIRVQPGAALMRDMRAILTLYDPKVMWARVDVRQEQVAQLKVGQGCLVKLVARKDKPYQGEVIRLDPLANLARDTLRAKVLIHEPDDNLRIDMTVTVDFLANEVESDDVPLEQKPLVLPRAALAKREGKDFVFVIRAGKAKLTPVELGETVGAGIVVKSGVFSGDLVAVTNLPMLEDGAAVRLEAEAQP
ncbi:MAG: efflux RND transporter periplasmic adaptor subunit [Planctomycetes bacterium]|nr:efflux RND transporter periplasmic adaptor subunit [Planctomycetota bacterium]